MALQHIVLFSFPRPLSADEEAEMRAMVASWPDQIGLMDKCRFGTDLTGARTRGYTQLLYTEFAGRGDARPLPGSPRPPAVPELGHGTRLHPARVRLPP